MYHCPMEYIKNRTEKYHQAKKGILADGIFSDKEIYDAICGLILYYLKSIKEDNYLPNIKIKKLQRQEKYLTILKEIKDAHFQKINFKDKKIFLTIFMTLEFIEKSPSKRVKI